jgi:hypothetical protein
VLADVLVGRQSRVAHVLGLAKSKDTDAVGTVPAHRLEREATRSSRSRADGVVLGMLAFLRARALVQTSVQG